MVIFSCSFFLVLYEYIYVYYIVLYVSFSCGPQIFRKLLCVLFSFFIFSTCQRKTKIDEINASGGVVGVRKCK